MSEKADPILLRTPINYRQAIYITLAMWFLYTFLFALYLPEPWASLAGFIPAIIAIGALHNTGISPIQCYLSIRKPSLAGLVVLVALFFPMLPVVIMGIKEVGLAEWDWLSIIVYSAASGFAQELYFRSALLPAMELATNQQSRVALLLSSLLFALFHAGMFLVAPTGAAVSALMVTFLVGLGLGWQVQRDRTVVWAMILHAILQIILRLFAWM